MRCGILFAFLLSFVIALPGFGQASDPVQVPCGTEPVLDGTIATDEWADAMTVELSPESMLFLKHSAGHLFLAIRAATMGVPSPLIVRGEEVHVLHASAALGTAIYAEQDGTWRLTQTFEWRCRTRGFAAAAIAERERFLAEEGWLGTIGYLGAPTEFEYMILLDEEPVRMLVLFMEATDPIQLLSWPIPADEAGDYLEIITGPVPDEVAFDLDQWAVLIPAPE
ncbi:hypothetical protein KJ567_07200 [Candidatus Bipolaricaulota bacterium]|nr:hypothetical protein [Candidatus Bipolaricaulota bacterium]